MAENKDKIKIGIVGIRKEVLAQGKRYAKFINFLKSFGSAVLFSKDFKLDALKSAKILFIVGPKSFYSESELTEIEKYFEEGGNVFIALGEGGDTKNNTNLNDLLKKNYGVAFHDDTVVRTSYYKYLHPKECYIEDTKFHPEIEKSISKGNKKKKVMNNEDLLDMNFEEDIDDSKLKIVYPYGCTLLNLNSKSSYLFTSGLLSYPVKRPLSIALTSKSKKGKMIVLGSERIVDDEFFEKEDNKKIIETMVKWLLSLSICQLDKPSKEVEIQEFNYTPSIVSISDNVKSCLEDVKDPPKNLNDLFDTNIYSIDNNLVPEALKLYDELNVKHDTLGIIPPQFETPLPPLQLAVFDPIIKDFDNPSLELYDLDEQFASEK